MSRTTSTKGNLALKEKKVIVIEASEKLEQKKIRVAAYARVSSDSDEQLNSYAAQNRYFTELIAKNDQWDLVDVYADEGISGRSMQKRDDFMRMLDDARKGKIDRIIVKSISRFARNTKECISTIRELKTLGVSIYFEEQNIDTNMCSGEMLTAMFAGLAQEESVSISKNMRWSYEKRMETGMFNTCCAPYGYRLDRGTLIINEEEARVVRMVFSDYLAGMNSKTIAEKLCSMPNIPLGNRKQWTEKGVRQILKNERYCGNSLLQKTYTTSTFPPVRKNNRGEVPQYYVESSHPAIIPVEMFQAAQNLKTIRNGNVTRTYEKHLFTGYIRCGYCGTSIQHDYKNGKSYWTCNQHREDASSCPTMQIPEEAICESFLRFYKKLKGPGMTILNDLYQNLLELRNRKMLWSKDVITMNGIIGDLLEQETQINEINRLGLVDPDFFIQKQNEIAKKLHDAKLEKERFLNIKSDDSYRKTKDVIETLEKLPAELNIFSIEVFQSIVECIEVESNQTLKFILKNGLGLHQSIERRIP